MGNAVTIFSGRAHVVSHQSRRSIELFGDHVGEEGRKAWPQPFQQDYFDVMDYVLWTGESLCLSVRDGVVWAMPLDDGVALCYEPAPLPAGSRLGLPQYALAG